MANLIPGLRLHHAGYATSSIPPLVNQYVSRFGYEVCTPLIHDPLQTAMVQFLRLPGDDVYLEFVAPDGPDSKLSRAAHKRGGLHHLCFMAQALENAIDLLVHQGMMLISEPQPAVAFAGRRICWLLGEDPLLVELVERSEVEDRCIPRLVADAP